MKFYCLFALLLVAGVSARPQFQQIGTIFDNFAGMQGSRPQFSNNSTTTARPTAPTTASARYLTCFQACPSTSEYNPICGSDNVNYQNEGKLNCAISCGNANVVAVRRGTCNPL